jgi:RecB family exonuclease
MAKKIKLSATRIGAFLQCKLKYWFQYVDHLPKIPSPAFKLGIAAHESLELAGQIWKEKEKFTKTDKKKIIDKYIEVSVREGIEDMRIHKEGIKLVTQRINDFDHGKIIALEKTFGYNDETSQNIITDEGVDLIGAIDKALEVDEDTLLIVDYKTSKTAPTMHQLKDDVQLSIYDLAASKLWSGYKRIILSLDMLRSDILYTYRTEEERKEFSAYLKVVYDQMVSLKKKDAKAHLNIFCPWCDYREYCDEYKKACKKSDYKFLKIAELDNKDLIEEWNEVRSVKKIIEGRERELSMTIMDKIRDSNITLKTDVEEIYIRQNSRVTYNKDTVKEFIPYEEFVQLVNLNKKAVENYIKNNPAIKDRVEATARVNYTAPFLAIKKVKVKE